MKKSTIAILAVVLLSVLAGCVRDNRGELNMREDYVVCFSDTSGARDFRDYLLSLAGQEQMTILDRGSEAEQELQSLEKGDSVLDRTAQPLILLTIEQKERLRISITNAGLGNDLNLTFRYSSDLRPAEATRVLQFANSEYRVVQIHDSGLGAMPCE